MNVLEYSKVPRRELKKWSNTMLRINFRKLEKQLIECIKSKDNLGKNAQTVYKKYKDKIKHLEEELQAWKEDSGKM